MAVIIKMSTYTEYKPCLKCYATNTRIFHMNDLTKSIQLYKVAVVIIIIIIIIINTMLHLRKLINREASCPQITKLERVAARTYTLVCVTLNPEPPTVPPYACLPDLDLKKIFVSTSFTKTVTCEWLSLGAGYRLFTKL